MIARLAMTEIAEDGSSKDSWHSLSQYFSLICYDLTDRIYTVKIPNNCKISERNNLTTISFNKVRIISRIKTDGVPYTSYLTISDHG